MKNTINISKCQLVDEKIRPEVPKREYPRELKVFVAVIIELE